VRLRTGLQAALAYVLLLAIVALGVPLALSLSTRVNDEVRSKALGEAEVVAAAAADLLRPVNARGLGTIANQAASQVSGRVMVVDGSGVVLTDAGVKTPETGASYASRPEIVKALAGQPVQLERASRTLGTGILATAVPIVQSGTTIGAVRITQDVTAVHAAVTRVELGLALIGIIVLAAGLLVGRVIAGQIARPLRRLDGVARRVADGDLSARAEVEGSREQRSLSTSFNEMTDRLARFVSSQRAFVADASHQLRTPLTGLRLRIEEARASGVSAEAAAQLDAGVAEVDRLAQIVDELLVLSRAGEREQPGERLDLAMLIDRALARWSATAADRGITLERGEQEGGPVWCSSADADRAIDVLIENALRYASRGTAVTVASDPGRVEVRDRGPGLGEQDGEALFERFHRGSAGRRGPAGSGLGLAIARELARGWGGDVTLRNRQGGGAVATFTLPEANE